MGVVEVKEASRPRWGDFGYEVFPEFIFTRLIDDVVFTFVVINSETHGEGLLIRSGGLLWHV